MKKWILIMGLAFSTVSFGQFYDITQSGVVLQAILDGTFSSGISVTGNIEMSSSLVHIEDTDTYMSYATDKVDFVVGGEGGFLALLQGAGGSATFNSSGVAGFDFIVKTGNDEAALTVDGGTDVTTINQLAVRTGILNDSYTLGTDSCYGMVLSITGARTITLPAAVAGMSITFVTIGANAVSIDVQGTDLIMLDGTALSDGDKITNGSASGDTAVFTYYDATGWLAITNGWTDGN